MQTYKNPRILRCGRNSAFNLVKINKFYLIDIKKIGMEKQVVKTIKILK